MQTSLTGWPPDLRAQMLGGSCAPCKREHSVTLAARHSTTSAFTTRQRRISRSCSARGQRHDWDTVTPPDSGFRCGETMTYQPLRLIGRSDRPTNRSCESAGHSLVQRSDLLLNSYY